MCSQPPRRVVTFPKGGVPHNLRNAASGQNGTHQDYLSPSGIYHDGKRRTDLCRFRLRFLKHLPIVLCGNSAQINRRKFDEINSVL
ncbi:hypothetical protein TNCV_4148431 [Trichonephila clavipes]|nr:hypothetical protein TNCV_4148431 [Trichonephila clavipes]